MGIPNAYRIKLFKTTRREFWYVGWTNFSFQFDEFGNPKTWWNGIIPNKNVGNLRKYSLVILDVSETLF